MFEIWNGYILICAIFLLILKYHWDRRKFYVLANACQGPPALPLVGNALTFLCKEEEVFQNISNLIESYPSPIRFWLGPKLVVILKTAEEMEKILTSSKLNDKDDIYRFLKVFNGLSLFTTNGAVWKKQRKYITPFLGHKYMESYFNVISESSTLLVQKLQEHVDKATFDIEYYLHRFYNDIATEVFIGFKPEAQNGKMDEILEISHKMYILVHSRMVKVWLHPDFIFRLSSNGREQIKGRNTFFEFIRKGITLTKLHKGECVKKTHTFVSVFEQLMACKNKDPDFYADQNELHHIATLYSAAEDTVTSICSYLLVLLGMYPHIQDKVLEEIRDILGTNGKKLEYKDLAEMKYLEMCVKEIIRLFPIGPYILRKVNADFQLGDRILPKDCTVMLSFYNVQRDPQYWEKPNDFYPEHFLPEAVSERHPFAFLPFSSGARSCPGKVFAYVAIKAVAATILQHYVVEADGTLQDMKFKADISIRPVEGYKLRIKRRIS